MSNVKEFVADVGRAARTHLGPGKRRDLVEALGLAENELDRLRDGERTFGEAYHIEATRKIVAMLVDEIRGKQVPD